jgi:hypothetical protein
LNAFSKIQTLSEEVSAPKTQIGQNLDDPVVEQLSTEFSKLGKEVLIQNWQIASLSLHQDSVEFMIEGSVGVSYGALNIQSKYRIGNTTIQFFPMFTFRLTIADRFCTKKCDSQKRPFIWRSSLFFRFPCFFHSACVEEKDLCDLLFRPSSRRPRFL